MRTRSLGLVLSLSLSASAWLAACGEPPPPATPVAPSASEGPAIKPSPAAVEASASDASAAGDPADASAPAVATTAPTVAPPPSTSGIVAEGHDECAAIAAPFEEKVRTKFNECYQAGKKKNPELAGTIKVTLKVDTKGKVGKVVADKSTLDAPVVQCMLKAVKQEPFDAKKCLGKDVAVSKTFGAR